MNRGDPNHLLTGMILQVTRQIAKTPCREPSDIPTFHGKAEQKSSTQKLPGWYMGLKWKNPSQEGHSRSWISSVKLYLGTSLVIALFLNSSFELIVGFYMWALRLTALVPGFP